jgi:2-oxoglutarate dehydrogenase E2 component (dihydrolipoamide succinyltransferase)
MKLDVLVPALGESVTEASVGKWYKKVGESVKADEILVELETDKITMEVAAEKSGVLDSISFETGSSVTVGTKLATIDTEKTEANSQIPTAAIISDKSDQTTEKNISTDIKSPENINKILSPAAQKIATEKQTDLSLVNGTGKDGRVTKADVLFADNNSHPNQQTTQASIIANDRSVERVKMTKLRQRIAERLKESQNTAAILTTFNEIDMFNVINLRKNYQDAFTAKFGVKLGFMSFFVKAAVLALQEMPTINARIENDEIIYHNFYDIGVAVGTDKGLVVPILKNAENMSLASIEKQIINLATKAKEGKLLMEDLTGGTFSITNGGVYGSLMSTPIINPPQSAILGMHATKERPVVVDGKIEIRPMMYVALSYDHRIIDGKEAVTFLVRIKELIESPLKLMLDF